MSAPQSPWDVISTTPPDQSDQTAQPDQPQPQAGADQAQDQSQWDVVSTQGQTPYTSVQPFPTQADPVTRFVKGFWHTSGAGIADLGKTLWDVATYASGDKQDLSPQTKQLMGNIISNQKDQWDKAQDAWSKGNYSEAAGYGLATALPLIGPAAAHAGESFGSTPPVYDKYGNVVKQGVPRNVAGGLGEATGLLLPYAAKAAWEKMPHTSRAAANIETAQQAAGAQPIDISGPGQAALDAQQFASRGGDPVKVIDDFVDRVTARGAPPMSFDEARDFYSNATAATQMIKDPKMLARVAEFRNQLGQSLQQAAEQTGVGEPYAAGVKEYAQANKLKRVATKVGSLAVRKGVGPALGTGIGGSLLMDYILNKIRGHAQGGPVLDRYPSRESVISSLENRR